MLVAQYGQCLIVEMDRGNVITVTLGALSEGCRAGNAEIISKATTTADA